MHTQSRSILWKDGWVLIVKSLALECAISRVFYHISKPKSIRKFFSNLIRITISWGTVDFICLYRRYPKPAPESWKRLKYFYAIGWTFFQCGYNNSTSPSKQPICWFQNEIKWSISNCNSALYPQFCTHKRHFLHLTSWKLVRSLGIFIFKTQTKILSCKQTPWRVPCISNKSLQ